MQKIKTRFAPSPTGLLHVGNIRTALIAWLFARKYDGCFMLRIDNTDQVRSTKEFEEKIKIDLSWLGLNWDEITYQNTRLSRYEEIKKRLLKEGKLYPCYESPEELAIRRKSQLASGLPPVYDRQSLKLTAQQIHAFEKEGQKPHFRFKLADQPIMWTDLVQGELKFEPGTTSDPIVIRADGTWTYMLCSVIDDVDFSISHIIRGDDHISNTATQIQLFEACGAPPPVFAHLPRISSKDAKISKRIGGFDIQSLREEKEIEAMTINNFLASIGALSEPSVLMSLSELAKAFEIQKFHKSPTTYTEQDLIRLNHKMLSQMSFHDVASVLSSFRLNNASEEFWLAVRNNLNVISDVKIWYQICFGSIQTNVSDRSFLLAVSRLLPEEGTWDTTTWQKWIHLIKAHTTKKGKEIFLPIRLALTGLDHGPELQYLLPLIGRNEAMKRLTS